MLLLLPALFSILLIFAGQEVDGKCEADQNEPWSYSGKNGPKYWSNIYPDCNGQNQSPINIITSAVVNNNSLTPFEFINYDRPITSAKIVNNGHTAQLTPTDGITRSIRNGGLNDVYNVSQFHFHWGSRRTRGSEHQINQQKFSMELHIVHTNSRNEIAVLGIFLQETILNNRDLGPFVKALKSIKYRGEETSLPSPLSLNRMLPANKNTYYRYTGSLTTPGCTEGVTWTLFSDIVQIGTAQVQEFRELHSTEHGEHEQCNLVDNYRPVQPLNGRQVSAKREDWRR